jgi:hypothetical protein
VANFELKVKTPTPKLAATHRGDRTLDNSCCDRLEEELSKLVTSALLNLGAGKHYLPCKTSVSDYQHNWGNMASLFPRFPT